MRVAGLLALLSMTVAGMPVTFFAKHEPHKVDELVSALHAASDPRSPSYGKHLSHAETIRLQRPASATVDAVEAHIASLGGVVTDRSLAGDKIVADVPATLRADALHPVAMHSYVDFVDGPAIALGSFPKSERKVRPTRAAALSAAESSVGPVPYTCLKDRVTAPCLRASYGINGTFGGKSAKNIGMAVIVNQAYKASDLRAFLAQAKLPAQTIDHNIGKLAGGAGDEASLDTQFIIAMGSGVPAWWVYINGEAANPFASWLTWASNTSSIPLVHSLSLGAPEGEVGAAIVGRMNAEMAALGARGISIVFASGDSGYKTDQNFGASSPFVTAVGGVYNGNLGDSKLEVDSISSGGFSSMNGNPIGAYQTAAVATYLKTTGDRPAKFNSSRRCVPDLSIYDSGYYIIQDGSSTPIGGTSAAAPSFSGMVALLNDARLSAGKSPLGFLNPFLYANEEAFFDITRGDNGGFAAVAGYDPASGLGTFATATFGKLKAAALALQ